MSNQVNCHCGSNHSFSNCCQPFIDRQQQPDSPEQLMRSRYTAFNLGDVNYLVDTLLPAQRQNDDKKQIEETIANTHWLGLKIINTNVSLANNTGIVDFVAFYQENVAKIAQLHEKSNFKKIANQWFYVDGSFLPPIKIGRNDNCFCASGKKFKKCHGL